MSHSATPLPAYVQNVLHASGQQIESFAHLLGLWIYTWSVWTAHSYYWMFADILGLGVPVLLLPIFPSEPHILWFCIHGRTRVSDSLKEEGGTTSTLCPGCAWLPVFLVNAYSYVKAMYLS